MATCTIKFRASSRAGQPGTVFYNIIHRRAQRQLTTPYRLFRGEWDESTSSPVDPEQARPRDGQDRASYINKVRQHMAWDMERLERIIKGFETSGQPYTADEVAKEYKKLTSHTLFSWLEKTAGRLKRNGRIRTAEANVATLNSMRKYLEDSDVPLDAIDSAFMEEYQAWMRKQGMAPNTISFYCRLLRSAYNRAVDEGLTKDRRPFRRVFTGIDKTIKRALPLPIIRVINGLDLTERPPLQYARDMFMLSFMLRGMSFIDMAMLKKRDLQNGHIIYRRRKTGQQLCIAWTREMQAIVDRYPKNTSSYLLPILRNDASNSRYAYKNAGERINRNLKDIGEMAGLDIPLSMYAARHSWASIAKSSGIPISVISEGLGHDNESTTRIYLASLDTSVIDNANERILGLL